MKKILIMVGTYYPQPLANGICTHQIALALQKKGYEIHIICIGSDEFQEDIIKDGFFIYPVKSRLFHKLRALGEKDIDSKKGKIYYNIAMMLNKIKKLIFIGFYPMTSPLFIWRYYNLGHKLHKEQGFDAVLSVYNPLEAIVAGSLLKKRYKDLKLIHYFLDSLTNDGGVKYLPRNWTSSLGFKWEEKVYKDADKILNLKCHENHHMQEKYNKYRKNMDIVDIPLLKKHAINTDSSNNPYDAEHTHIVYTGALSSIFRNPKYLCEMFIKLNNVSTKYKLHFYSRGDVEDLLEEYQKKTNGGIIRHGYVKYSESIKAIYHADVLISIGNENSEMIPSKTFEYMATGKKIIHFYKNEYDSSLSYYEKYPLVLLINENDNIEFNFSKIREFLNEPYEEINFEEISKIFIENTPEYSANIIANTKKINIYS